LLVQTHNHLEKKGFQEPGKQSYWSEETLFPWNFSSIPQGIIFSVPKPPPYLCLGTQIWLPLNCWERINFLCLQFCLWSVNKSQELLYAKYFSAKHLLHGRSATITQQSLIGYGFAATHVSLNLLIVRNKDFNGLHPDTKGKFPLG